MRTTALVLSLLVTVLLACIAPQHASAQSVLLIYDTTGSGTPALTSALTNAGYTVTLSDTAEFAYNGSNPSPSGFDAVIHLNGPTYSQAMPTSGRTALINYVQAGGGFIHAEWNAYEVDEAGTMSGFEDLTLFVRTGGGNGSGTVNVVAAQAGHPVLAGVPSTFSIPGGSGFGTDGMRTFTTQPATLLASDQSGQGAVAVREFGSGRVVGFHSAGNYSGSAPLQDVDLQQLYINAVAWSSGSVVVNQPPVADAGGPYTIGLNSALTMDGSGSSDPDGTIVDYAWDCTDDGVDDGNSSSPTGVSCTYASPGTYTARLTVTDDIGDTGTATTTVSVTNAPPTADPGGPYTVNQGAALPLIGTGSSDSDGTITTWQWDCTNDGTVDVTASSGIGNACTYAEVGTYTLALTVTDNFGATDTDTTGVTVTNTAPTADAGGPYTVLQGAALALDGSGSGDADGTITDYAWDCENDGSIDVSSSSPTGSTCAYAAVGSYTINLVVTDDDGDTASATASVSVGNAPPTADAGGPYAGDEGSAVPLDGSASSDVGSVVQWEWDCTDDGTYDITTSTATGVGCTWDDDATYTIRLRVTDNDGGTAEATTTAVIANVAPTAVISGPTTGDEGALLSFSAVGADVGAADLPDLTYSWDWGDGTTDTGAAADHTWADNGPWTVTLSIDDQDGGIGTETYTVTTANVDPTITSTAPTTAVQGTLYSYSAVVDDPGTADTFVWTLGAGAPGTMTVDANGLVEWTPTYAEAQVGSYTFDLTVTDDDGGAGSESITITVTTADADGDGLPDDWETQYGLDPNDPSDATLDGDADGLDNLGEFAAGTDPTSYDGPSAPTPVSPVAAAEVPVDMPDLVWDNATDPQADVLTYDVEVYSDAALTTLVTSATGVAEDASGTTTWTVDVALTENASAWWRVRANDPNVAGAWTTEEEFVVNAADEEPGQPTLVFPIGGETTSLTPDLVWTAVSDVDGDDVTYEVEVWDLGQTTLITSATGLTDGGAADVSWTVDVTLTEDAVYVWTARAVDEDGLASAWALVEEFIASESNAGPSAPFFVNPLDGDSLDVTQMTVVAAEGADPEGAPLEYLFELDVASTFDTADYQSATLPETGSGFVEWDMAAAGVSFVENATNYARVRATDPEGVSSAPETIAFFVRGTNDPPSVPVLVSPADGAEGGESLTVEIEEPIDPEGDDVFVEFVAARDAELTDVIGTIADVPVDGSGALSWTVEVSLEPGEYFWSARASDEAGATSEWAAAFRYVVPAAGDDDDDDDDGPGAGCDCESSVAGGGANLTWLLLLLPLALRRRR